MRKRVIICFSVVAIIIVLAGAIVLVVKNNEYKESERKLEARFDKFMGYFYPYLNDISKAADIYKRMQISLIYDYTLHQKGRYIYEDVSYYDGGTFSMRDYSFIEKILEQASNLFFYRAYGPIQEAPQSRIEERFSLYKILNAAKELFLADIYNDDIALQSRVENVDSLNMEIQFNMHSLIKYKNSSPTIDLNSISEAEYDLNNY